MLQNYCSNSPRFTESKNLSSVKTFYILAPSLRLEFSWPPQEPLLRTSDFFTVPWTLFALSCLSFIFSQWSVFQILLMLMDSDQILAFLYTFLAIQRPSPLLSSCPFSPPVHMSDLTCFVPFCYLTYVFLSCLPVYCWKVKNQILSFYYPLQSPNECLACGK